MVRESQQLKKIFTNYERASGQFINYDKSYLLGHVWFG